MAVSKTTISAWRQCASAWLLSALWLPAQADNAQRLEFKNASGLRAVNTEHFEILYRPRFEWAVSDVAVEAESAFSKLNSVFGSFPDQKIVLHLVDSSDWPVGQTLTAPQPFIRIWVAPVSDANGYGHLRLSSRFRLSIAHELVHMAMGSWHDQTGNIFGQVRSTVNEPMTFPFALMTQSKRFAPLWFHEGAAVLLETWLTDGQGRILGNLDEAYFRTCALHDAPVPHWKTVDVQSIDDAFNVNGSYFYGARFMAWLAREHGAGKVVQWLREYHGASMRSPFGAEYKRIFAQTLDADWVRFFEQEYAFQQRNIAQVNAAQPRQSVIPVGEVTGLVSSTHADPQSGDVFFVEVPLHDLPRVVRFNPATGETTTLARGHVGAPAFVNVAVTAFDSKRRIFYFSQDTSVGWRDLYQVDVSNGQVSKVADNLRQTNLTVNPATGDLWGTVLLRGESHLARLARPFSQVQLFAKLPLHASLRDFAFSPDGASIAAVLQNHASTQLVLIDPQLLAQGGSLKFTSVAEHPDPENPTWSSDGGSLYFSSYFNGISNVFRHDVRTGKTTAISNVPDGLYKPTILHGNDANDEVPQVLAFQLLARSGFQPVRVPADADYTLSRIEHLGESVVPRLAALSQLSADNGQVVEVAASSQVPLASEPFEYQALRSVKLNTLVPALGRSSTGESAFGLYGEASDVLNHHRFAAGISTNDEFDDLYWSLNYRFKDFYRLDFSQNPSSLYTLVNDMAPTPDGWTASLSRRFWYQADEAGQRVLDVGVGYDGNVDDAFLNANYTSAFGRASITGRRGIERGWVFGGTANLFLDVGGQSSDPSATVELRGRLSDTFVTAHNRVSLLMGIGQAVGTNAVGFQIRGFPNEAFESRGPNQYQNASVFPGLDSDTDSTLVAQRYLRVQVSNDFPVMRLYKALGAQRADLLEVRTFATALFSDAKQFSRPDAALDRMYSLGVQVDVRLTHFFSLNSTLSLGIAQVWNENLDNYDNHGFVSWNWFSF